MSTETSPEIERLEIRLLLEAVFEQYGYDFREYAAASLRRRIRRFLSEENLPTVSALQGRILHDPACLNRFVHNISVDVSSLFRDPLFYLALRKKVAPLLGALPFVRLWHAGCSTGEEVYSTAILLTEENLYGKARIYATDMDEMVLSEAKEGIYPLSTMKEYTENYIKAGGTASFSYYYVAQYDHAVFNAGLKKNIVWAQHNLATDSSFNEFHLIFCRNVMIYFDTPLLEKVHELLYRSLAVGGFLALGSKESLTFTRYESCYQELDGSDKIFRKMR